MPAYVFGKAVFCDQSNLSASRAYINNTLLTRGILHDAEAQLKFNSADAPAVINLLYDLLKKAEQDDVARENMSVRIRQISIENDRLIAHENTAANNAVAHEREIGLLKNKLAHSKDEITKAHLETKQYKDTLSKTTLTLNHTKLQMANELRKRDTQIVRMKEHLVDGGTVRRSKASSSMTIRNNTSSINSGAPIAATHAVYNPALQASLREECDDHLVKLTQEVSIENEQLAELLQATLASLDALVQIEEEEHPLFYSSAQSVIMLEAQLKVRLTALRNILDIPNYVPIDEVEMRDVRIRELQARLMQIEHEWSAAQNVLKGLTASVLEKSEVKGVPKDETGVLRVLGESNTNTMNMQTGAQLQQSSDYLTNIAKTPVAISKENGLHPLSTIKLNSRLPNQNDNDDLDLLQSEMLTESTPIRARKEKAQRKNRRITMSLFAKEEDLDAELEQYLSIEHSGQGDVL